MQVMQNIKCCVRCINRCSHDCGNYEDEYYTCDKKIPGETIVIYNIHSEHDLPCFNDGIKRSESLLYYDKEKTIQIAPGLQLFYNGDVEWDSWPLVVDDVINKDNIIVHVLNEDAKKNRKDRIQYYKTDLIEIKKRCTKDNTQHMKNLIKAKELLIKKIQNEAAQSGKKISQLEKSIILIQKQLDKGTDQ